jgi:hypothetical protein
VVNTTLRILVAPLLVVLLAGCATKPRPLAPDDEDDEGGPPIVPSIRELFKEPQWPAGGSFSYTGTPPFDMRGSGGDHPVDQAVGHSDPAFGPTVPRDADEIIYQLQSLYEMYREQIDLFVTVLNGGLPTAGDLALLPSFARLTPPDERYHFFQVNTQAPFVVPDDEWQPGLTRVIGFALGGESGGYEPMEPFTDDTFAGALVWMKATQNPQTGRWNMDQRDWKVGSGAVYPTSARFLMRGNSAVVKILESELEELGATWYRWDTFSYTTDVGTEWSHDFTPRLQISF